MTEEILVSSPSNLKSFSAKQKMVNAALNAQNMIYIVDPQGEYSPLIKLLGGKEVKIKTNSNMVRGVKAVFFDK